MKVKYTKDHDSGKVGEVKDHPTAFAHYLMVKGVAVQHKEEIITKEEKVVYKTKKNVSK